MVTSKTNTNKKISIKNKKFLQMIIAVCLVIILLVSALLFNFVFRYEDNNEDIIEPTIPITHYSTKTYDQMKQEGILEQIEIINY